MANRKRGPQPARSSRSRRSNIIEVRQRFLIVCEGEKTEPLYFQSFKAPGRILTVEGTGHNTLSLVDEAIRLREEKQAELKKQDRELFDQCWCVFDRDSFPAGNFNSAIVKARANGFQVAYSNVCFELWYLLHFAFQDAATTRESYSDKLSSHLGARYEKNSRTMYDTLLSRQQDAIHNAKTLLASHPTPNPEENDPSTTVFALVEELNKSVLFPG